MQWWYRDAAHPDGTGVGLSDGLAVFRLSGGGAPWLLGKLSGLDYQAGIKTGRHCARTRMGHISVLVHYRQVDDGTFGFDLVLAWQAVLHVTAGPQYRVILDARDGDV